MAAARRAQPDEIVQVSGDWAAYERIMAKRGDRSAPRIAYLDGAIEIMSPSIFHESVKSLLGSLVEVWCLDRRLDFSRYGSWTLKRRQRKAGAEPDECFAFRKRAALRNPGLPDLAIEVVWSRRQLKKIEIYRRLQVAELWTWEDGRITVHLLRRGQYVESARSKALPGIDVDQLGSLATIRPASAALRAYRAALVRVRARRRRERRSKNR